MKTKILFVLSNLTWNRAPLFVELSKSDKFEVKFLFTIESYIQKYDYDQDKLRQFLIKYMKENNACFEFIYNWQLVKYLLVENYDILIGGSWDNRREIVYLLFLFLASTVRRKKFILNNADRWREKFTLKIRAINLFIKFILIKIHKVIVSGKKQKTYIQRFGFRSEDIIVINLGSEVWIFSEKFDLQEYFKKKETFKIGFCGRYELEVKGIRYLKEAFSILDQKFKSIELFIVGHESSEINQNIYELKAIPPEQLHHFYENIDLLVLPSIQTEDGSIEAWGYIINEAYQFGIPVITTDKVGCAGEIVENYKNGFIVKEKNPQDMAEKIEILIKDKKLYREISKNNKILFNEKLRYKKIAKQWGSFLEKL